MKTKNFAALIAAISIAASVAAVPASASSSTVYSTTIEGIKVTSFEKYLVMESNSVVPNASFSFTIAAGEAVAGTDTTLPILAGVGTPKFLLKSVTDGMEAGDEKTLKTNDNDGTASKATVNFTSADTDNTAVTIAEGDKGEGKTVKFDTPANTTDEKYAQKKIAIDFSDIVFTEPGVYRYVITEADAAATQAAGVTNDADNTRVLDVVVSDTSSASQQKLSITNYLLHDSIADTPVKDSSGTNATIADKSTGFTNQYESYDLQFSKQVTGNQGSRDKFFKFDISITNAKGSEITVLGQGTTFLAAPTKSTTTSYEETDMNAANTKDDNTTRDGQQLTADADGNITATFYIRNGQSVKLLGLPAGAKYTVTEAEEDYTPSVNATEANTGDVAVNENNNGITDQDTGIKGDTNATFINTRNGNIPTGVISTAAGSAGIAAVGLVGVIFGVICVKKKKSEEE